MKLNELEKVIKAFESIANVELRAKQAFIVANNIRNLYPLLDDYLKQKDKLIVKYGENVEGTTYKVKPDKIDEFMKEFNELGNTEVEVILKKIQLEDDIKIKPCDILILNDYIEEVE